MINGTMLPKVITVKSLKASRYDDFYKQGKLEPGNRPLSWDLRMAGLDYIDDDQGNTYCLYSSGGQSPPKPGWKILLTSQLDDQYEWTLYGMPREV